MTAEQFNVIVDAKLEDCRSEMVVKNADYAAPEDGDFLRNFYDTAKRTGTTPYQAWLVHFEKHIIAIERFCKSGGLSSEPIHGRTKDAINYILLLEGLIEESKNDKTDLIPTGRSAVTGN